MTALLSDFAIVLHFIRRGFGVSQAKLGERSGVSPTLINDYEHGRKALNRERLEYLISSLGLPPEAIDAALRCLGSLRSLVRPSQASTDRFNEAHHRIAAVAEQVGRLATEFAQSALSLLTIEAEALSAREEATRLWQRHKDRMLEDLKLLVKEASEFQTWAFCERLAAESIAQASNHPRRALELAELAREVAERVPGSQSWRERLTGYAWAHIANARRVSSDLPAAERALGQAWKLWQQGAAGDPGLLDPVWLPWIEAALRKDQRRFAAALEQIETSLGMVKDGSLRGKILLSKASILQVLGNPEASAEALREAAPWVDARAEPRLAFLLRFTLVANLCQAGRTREARELMPSVRTIAEGLGEPIDLTRVVWLDGKILAAENRTAEARTALEHVARDFTARELAYDAALVSLELAIILLSENHSAEVRSIAAGLIWVFRSQGIHREALAALRVFVEAAKKHTATSELARRILSFLNRAQADPDLEFEEAAEG